MSFFANRLNLTFRSSFVTSYQPVKNSVTNNNGIAQQIQKNSASIDDVREQLRLSDKEILPLYLHSDRVNKQINNSEIFLAGLSVITTISLAIFLTRPPKICI